MYNSCIIVAYIFCHRLEKAVSVSNAAPVINHSQSEHLHVKVGEEKKSENNIDLFRFDENVRLLIVNKNSLLQNRVYILEAASAY